MNALTKLFLHRPRLVRLLWVLGCGAGLVVMTALSRAALPQQSPRLVSVEAVLPGATAVDVERFVTFRLEEALRGIPAVRRMASVTEAGRASISLKLHAGESPPTIADEVQARVDAVRHLLPRDVEFVRVRAAGSGGVRMDALISVWVSPIDASATADRQAVARIEEALKRVPGVLEATSSLPPQHVYIRFDDGALARAGLSVRALRVRVEAFLAPRAVGSVWVDDDPVAVRVRDPFDDLAALRDMPLRANRAGRGVRLGDVATVAYDLPPVRLRHHLNGAPQVAIELSAHSEADVVTLSAEVEAVLARLRPDLPSHISVRIGDDMSGLIEHEFSVLKGNGLGGIVLVFVVLSLFLGWRIAVVTALGLPFCYLGLVALFPLVGLRFDFVSLVALILVVGILVDDAIIVAEAFADELAGGGAAPEAALRAVARVGRPVLGMMISTTVAFLPLLLLRSDADWLVRPLPLIVIGALLLSLVDSFFLLPSHLVHFVPRRLRKTPAVVRGLLSAYRVVLRGALRFRYLTAVLGVVLVAGAVGLVLGPVRFLGSFSINSEAEVFVELSERASDLDALEAVLRPVQAQIDALPEGWVEDVRVVYGEGRTPSGATLRGLKFATFRIAAPGDFAQKERRAVEIQSRLAETLAPLQSEPRFARISAGRGGPARDVVRVYVSGSDRIPFETLQHKIQETVSGLSAVEDVFIDPTRFQEVRSFDLDDRALLAHGRTRTGVESELREYFSEREIARFRRAGVERMVYLERATPVVPTAKNLDAIAIPSANGRSIPLAAVGRWQGAKLLRRIEHQDMLRVFEIDVRYDGEASRVEAVAESIESALLPLQAAYPGYHISVRPPEAHEEGKRWTRRPLGRASHLPGLGGGLG